MPLDPSNVVARTAAGEAELARATQGLAIAQRKLLATLEAPVVIDELVLRYGIEGSRLEGDLQKLASLGLVVIHGAGRTTSGGSPRRIAPTPVAAPPANAPVPRPPRRPPRRALTLLLVALLMVLGMVLIGRTGATPDLPPPAAGPAPVAMPASLPASPRAAPARPLAPGPAASVDVLRALTIEAPVGSAPAPRVSPAAPGPAPLPVAANAVPAQAASRTTLAPVPIASAPVAVEPVARPAPANDAAAVAPSPAGGPPATAAPVAPAAALPPPAAIPPSPPPVVAERAPAPVVLAAAAPSALPAERPAVRTLVPLAQESPPFPRDALHAGVKQGTVRARLTLDAAGRVTNVAILDAQPRRVFDRAVTASLARWTYEPGAAGRTTEVEVAFRRD